MPDAQCLVPYCSLMAKPSPANSTKLITEAQDRFINIWGQMGSAWGISRTMAQVHALLYITGEALCTDDVMDRLEISRGNASMSLRALQDWGIIERVHKRGDRKEYFTAVADVWTMFQTIARERKKRELDPVVASLYEIRDMTGVPSKEKNADPIDATLARHNQRLDEMLNFISTIEKLSQHLVNPDGAGLKLAMALLSKSA